MWFVAVSWLLKIWLFIDVRHFVWLLLVSLWVLEREVLEEKYFWETVYERGVSMIFCLIYGSFVNEGIVLLIFGFKILCLRVLVRMVDEVIILFYFIIKLKWS